MVATSATNALSKGEMTRRDILRAAVARFGRDGYRATSVADIARAAGVGGTVPYAYFANKEALFLAAVDEDAAAVIHRALDGVFEGAVLPDWQETLLVTLLGAVEEHALARRLLAGLEPEEAYVTVGTGIGGAVAPLTPGPRSAHAEMGHLPVRRHPHDADFAGICPFHRDCLEGMASGPAVRARWGCDLSQLPADHPGRAIIAGYIAQLACAIALLHAPEVLVIGGGVMSDGSLLPRIRSSALEQLGGYLMHLRDAASMHAFITPPALGRDSAIAGATLMALEAAPRAV